ncbi:hypothetical protein [Streptomyces sp. NPDC001070]
MSRTVHHVPPAHHHGGAPGAWTGHELVVLRRAAGGRVRRLRFDAYAFPRGSGTPVTCSRNSEGQARAALRAFRMEAGKALRGAGVEWTEAAAELDLPPTRHRHRAVWGN